MLKIYEVHQHQYGPNSEESGAVDNSNDHRFDDLVPVDMKGHFDGMVTKGPPSTQIPKEDWSWER